MPIFIAALLGGLVSAMSSFVGRALVALGVSYVTYTGIDAVTGWIFSEVQDRIGDAPTAVVQVLGLLQVDTCLSILASAVAARHVIAGLTAGKLTRMVIK